MNSVLQFTHNFLNNECNPIASCEVDPAPESLIEKVQELLLEVKLLRTQLAQAEKKLSQDTNALCEALYAEMELRKFAKSKPHFMLVLHPSESRNLPSVVTAESK